MAQRTGIITFAGNPLTLTGNEVKAGDTGPDFTAVSNDLSEFKLSGLAGKVVIISSVPSLDTPVCALQTKRFNQEATNLNEDVSIVTISMDLPFAQARWCGAEGVNRLQTVSDHRTAAFGEGYGLLIQELRLLARAVLVLGRDGKIAYYQLVKELTEEPDYAPVLEAVKQLA